MQIRLWACLRLVLLSGDAFALQLAQPLLVLVPHPALLPRQQRPAPAATHHFNLLFCTLPHEAAVKQLGTVAPQLPILWVLIRIDHGVQSG